LTIFYNEEGYLKFTKGPRYKQMYHVHPYSIYVFLQLIFDGSPSKHLRTMEKKGGKRS
jgi:hypothetical protein